MNYIGIDLGTTNSVIATFDGTHTRVWKSKEQSDVMPSVIYEDRRGKRFYGQKAYNMSIKDPSRAALLFKRFMGTSTPIVFGDHRSTPEECSAEILKQLFHNLPEEIRGSEENGIVITVPAAFDQMQNAATLEAARLANLGSHVKLIQEPVAAIMSVMKVDSHNGNFLIFDMGGGTLDIAIADSMNGKVNLLAHGGIAMCGGRDFDRKILNSKIIPWLFAHYSLPDDFKVNPDYKTAQQIAVRAAEEAKIGLSIDNEVVIDADLGIEDLNGESIYLDVPFHRDELNDYIASYVNDAVEAARQTIQKAGLTPLDFDRIVFVGGPTNYKPLRDKVSKDLGIEGSLEVNPMTAVAEGAAIFAESIDWSTAAQERKAERALVKSQSQLGLSFKYTTRTTDDAARAVVHLTSGAEGYTFEIASAETGWNSGTMTLENKMRMSLPLSKSGDNHFVVTVYDPYGREVVLEQKELVITKTLATVGAILASHSIGVEIQESMDSGNNRVLDYLIRENDTLPAEGEKEFRAAESVRAGTDDELRLNLWEGDIAKPVEDNLFIGCMRITGKDFNFGTIQKGDKLICRYTISEAGSISLRVTVPSIDEDFSGRNFYSRMQGEKDWTKESRNLTDEAGEVLGKIENLTEAVSGKDRAALETLSEKVRSIQSQVEESADSETVKKSFEELLNAKKSLYAISRNNESVLRQREADMLQSLYEEDAAPYASPSMRLDIEKQMRVLHGAVAKDARTFEREKQAYLSQLFPALFRNPRFVAEWFRDLAQTDYPLYCQREADELIARGLHIIKTKGSVEDLASVVLELRRLAPQVGKNIMANITRY